MYVHLAVDHWGACRIQLEAIDHSCMCGEVQCRTACPDFALASEPCRPVRGRNGAATQPGHGVIILAELSGAHRSIVGAVT